MTLLCPPTLATAAAFKQPLISDIVDEHGNRIEDVTGIIDSVGGALPAFPDGGDGEGSVLVVPTLRAIGCYNVGSISTDFADLMGPWISPQTCAEACDIAKQNMPTETPPTPPSNDDPPSSPPASEEDTLASISNENTNYIPPTMTPPTQTTKTTTLYEASAGQSTVLPARLTYDAPTLSDFFLMTGVGQSFDRLVPSTVGLKSLGCFCLDTLRRFVSEREIAQRIAESGGIEGGSPGSAVQGSFCKVKCRDGSSCGGNSDGFAVVFQKLNPKATNEDKRILGKWDAPLSLDPITIPEEPSTINIIQIVSGQFPPNPDPPQPPAPPPLSTISTTVDLERSTNIPTVTVTMLGPPINPSSPATFERTITVMETPGAAVNDDFVFITVSMTQDIDGVTPFPVTVTNFLIETLSLDGSGGGESRGGGGGSVFSSGVFGGVLGGIVGVVCLGVLGVLAFVWRRRRGAGVGVGKAVVVGGGGGFGDENGNGEGNTSHWTSPSSSSSLSDASSVYSIREGLGIWSGAAENDGPKVSLSSSVVGGGSGGWGIFRGDVGGRGGWGGSTPGWRTPLGGDGDWRGMGRPEAPVPKEE
ncbi:hypothetical protein HDU67_001485 [Dinochytrium kinnereticum]|nr:hypothetical protein HDU67_001485 [Dinochytrium kinnereticum]